MSEHSPSSLPQDLDSATLATRRRALERARSLYAYDRHALAPFVISRSVPPEERYTVEYHRAMVQGLTEAAHGMATAELGPPLERYPQPEDYARLYGQLPRPHALLRHHWQDWCFSEQRLAGPNPMVLRRVDGQEGLADLREKIPLERDHLEQALVAPGDSNRGCSLVRAVEERRLFVADYELLEGLPCGTWERGRKYLTAPVAVFCWRSTGQRDRGELVPFAIQLGQDREAGVFTPAHGPAWRLAKLWVQIADANHHEMASHLAGTHLALEPFAVATARNLGPEHPVRRLLAPHLRFLIARNEEARQSLVAPDGAVDRLLAGTLEASLEVAARARRGYKSTPGWGLISHAFDSHLGRRGVLDPEVLPHYPYRDDGLLLWAAIGAFTHEYLKAHYPNPQRLTHDGELQAWASELANPVGGAVPEMPSPIEDLATLALILQVLLFTAGPQHAATNYPQYDSMGFVANMPMAGYAPPPRPEDGASEEDYLRTLPPIGLASQQVLTVFNLSYYRHDRLGVYDDEVFDPRDRPARDAFRRRLREAEDEILRRNQRRRLAYPYLQPSLVPNSTSV